MYLLKKYLFFLFLIPSSALFSQQGWWTWLHGTTGPVPPGNYGVQGVAAPTNEPPAMYKTDACWTDSQGKFWFFGGDLGASALWKYDPVTNLWTWMKGPNTNGSPAVYGTKGVPAAANNPPPLMLGAVTWIDANDNLWLWGGMNGTYQDMWRYNPVTNMWTWMHGPGASSLVGVYGTQGVPAAANIPPSRYETSASWVDNNGKFWFFGGGSLTGQMSDMWKYDPVINQWAWMKGPQTSGNTVGNYGTQGVAAAANNPPCRWVYCRWKDNAGNFWMFGGTGVNNNTDSYNDLWKFDPATNNWTWMSGNNTTNPMPAFPPKCVPSTTAFPQGRYENHVAWKDKCGNFWMYSGQWTSAQGSPQNADVWCYKPQTNEWVFVNGNMVISTGVKGTPAGSNWPGNVYGAGAFVYNNEFYMFGGRQQSSGNANLLWKFIPDSVCAKSFCNTPPINPIAHFSADTLIGCAPLTVQFYNSSMNSTSWVWDFGDGSPTSTVQNPSHTYTLPGNYTVTLIASNGTTSDTLVFTNYVNVIQSAVAGFTVSPNDTICLGQSVTFTNTSINGLGYMWFVLDASWATVNKGDTTTNFTYTFSSTGLYHIILNVDGLQSCDDRDTMDIVVLTSYSATQNVSLCSGNTYTLPGGNIANAAGTYIDTLGPGPCDSIITTIITMSPASTFTQNPVICVGNTFTLPDNSTTGTAGTYTDTVTTGAGCDSIITTNLTVVTSFNVTQNDTICTGNSYTLPDGSIATVAGTYLDTITAQGGCDSIITTNLTVTAANTSAQNPVLCAGNSFTLPDGSIVSVAGTYIDTVNAANGCDSIITTNLTLKPNSSFAQNASICSGNSYTLPSGIIVTVSGTYNDTLLSGNGCDSIITTALTVNSSPVAGVSPDVIILTGQSTNLTATGGGTYNWFPSTGLDNTNSANVIATPDQTTIYCVEITSSNGCKDTACVTVTVEIPCPKSENLAVPNAFSPNADGVNDEFCLQGWEYCITEFNIRIYDRWGEKVFESNQSDFCWDGVFKGKKMDAQVFVYYIRAKFSNIEKYLDLQGNISLIK